MAVNSWNSDICHCSFIHGQALIIGMSIWFSLEAPENIKEGKLTAIGYWNYLKQTQTLLYVANNGIMHDVTNLLIPIFQNSRNVWCHRLNISPQLCCLWNTQRRLLDLTWPNTRANIYAACDETAGMPRACTVLHLTTTEL